MSESPVAAAEHTAWLLELGAAARADQERPVLRKGYLGRWSSRRARARARRAVIRERLEAAVEPKSIDDTLVDRLTIYTHDGAQPAATTSLLSIATGPGSAWATTQTEKR